MFAALAVLGVAGTLASCTQKPITVPLRSLENSGKIALFCASDPLGGDAAAVPVETCTHGVPISDPNDYVTAPTHLYGLITQATHGEVAVIDFTAQSVIDANPGIPGVSHLPVGANPVDVVTTHGSNAAFVATAEVGKPAIYAIPERFMRGALPTLTDFPACLLPGRPGAMVMLQRTGSDQTECANPVYTPDYGAAAAAGAGGDAGAGGATDTRHVPPDLSKEGGLQRILVTLPDTGDYVVLDPQALLNVPLGTFEGCPIDRRARFEVNLPPGQAVSLQPGGDQCPPEDVSRVPVSATCSIRTPPQVTYGDDFTAKPYAMKVSGNRLFVTDQGAPVVHQLDVGDPCAIAELPPLLPASFDEPTRPIFTSALAVSPLTHDNKRFAYVGDYEHGTVMVFDVSDDSTNRTPLVRGRPDLQPGVPRDRLDLGAPATDITFVQKDIPQLDANGTDHTGVLCNPSSTDVVNASTGYRTLADYSAGAGPHTLRGIIALAALTNGNVVYVDVDDLDAPCRHPQIAAGSTTTSDGLPAWTTGCEDCANVGFGDYLGASAESSCRTVARHELRDAYFFSTNDFTGPHVPSTAAAPDLSLNGSSLSSDDPTIAETLPKIRGPARVTGASPDSTWNLPRGGASVAVDSNPRHPSEPFVVPDLREPRAATEQSWSVTFEGVYHQSFSGDTDGGTGRLDLKSNPQTFYDTGIGFCDAGVHDPDAAAREGVRLGDPDPSFGAEHGDEVEIMNELQPQDDPYWSGVVGQCSYVSCLAAFGNQTSHQETRFFPITKAYQDHLEISSTPIVDYTGENGGVLDPQCCFPTLVRYVLRARHTWIVNASAGGFQHHVITGPDGRCVDAGRDPSGAICDLPTIMREGRVYEVPYVPPPPAPAEPNNPTDAEKAAIAADDAAYGVRDRSNPYVFHNSEMFFVVYAGSAASQRDMSFTFDKINGFVPMAFNIGRGSVYTSPQTIVYSDILGEAIVTDASLQGVVSVDLPSQTVEFSYY